MYDHKPQDPLVKLTAETPPESFETRVLRELAAISERLVKLEAASSQIVARRSGTFYDPLGSTTFTFSGVKDEDGVPVDFTLDPLGVVRIDRQKATKASNLLLESKLVEVKKGSGERLLGLPPICTNC